MNREQRPGSAVATTLLDRAFNAGAVLTAGVVAVTGLFVVKIAHSYAASHPSTAVTTPNPDDSSDEGGFGLGGGQLSVPPQNQQPLGGSNGS